MTRPAKSECFPFELVRTLLVESSPTGPSNLQMDATPITHNGDVLFIQFSGWSINLYTDGTWAAENTTGG
jgi:hypothetical protein